MKPELNKNRLSSLPVILRSALCCYRALIKYNVLRKFMRIIKKSGAKFIMAASIMLALPLFTSFSEAETALNDETESTLGKAKTIEVLMTARYSIFEIARGSFSLKINNNAYAAAASYHTSGIVAAFNKNAGNAKSRGIIVDDNLKPLAYSNLESIKAKRKTFLSYNGAVPNVSVTPEFTSLGDPPATESQKTNTIDPVSGLSELALITDKDKGKACGANVRIFDGKRRYDIATRFVAEENISVPAYKGKVFHCSGTYTKIAGFKAKDMVDGKRQIKFELWLANLGGAGVSVPVRIKGTMDGNSVILYATKATLN